MKSKDIKVLKAEKRVAFRMAAILHALVVAIVIVLSVTGCKPGIPDKYLQPGEMADILYDYHLAAGIAVTAQPDDSIALRTYRLSILKHHRVSEADFDSSMVYYTRHTALLEDVYKKIADRLNSESEALGGSTVGFGGDFASADTTNVWSQSPSFVLSPYAAFNRMSFEMKADTAYHEGDNIMLDFDAQFIYQDGMRDAVVVLAVTYENDSTEYVTNSVMSSAHYHLQVDNSGRMRIKSLRGFFMLSRGNDAMTSATTLRLLVVNNVKLIRMHTKAPAVNPLAPADSLRTVTRDSMPKPARQPLRPSSVPPASPAGSGQTMLNASKRLRPVQDKSLLANPSVR